MTTTAKTIAADTILAIDLGKYKSVTCIDRSANDWQVSRSSTVIPETLDFVARTRRAR